jgi:hypothetical protein
MPVKVRNGLIGVVALLCAGCWNGGNSHTSFGDVSIGQQLLDLKTALAQQAITQSEYDRLKQTLIMAVEGSCNAEED